VRSALRPRARAGAVAVASVAVAGSLLAAPASAQVPIPVEDLELIDEELLEELIPDFGFGKLTLDIAVEPVTGSRYPEGADLSGATFSISYRSIDGSSTIQRLASGAQRLDALPVLSTTCTTTSLGACPSIDADGWTDIEVTQTAAPRGFLLPEDTSRALSDASCIAFGPFLDCRLAFPVTGAYRTLGLTLTSAVDATPLAGGAFTLCPATAETACADGAAGTTGPDGALTLPGLLAPGDYSLWQTAAPAGYVAGARTTITVPPATSPTDAGTAVIAAVTNAADVAAPVAADDEAATTAGTPVEIDLLANDEGHGAPLTVTSTQADGSSGTLSLADGVATFTPAAGFSGTTSFTYVATSRGGSDTGTARITVAPGQQARPTPTPAPPGAAPRPTVLPTKATRPPLARPTPQLPATGGPLGVLAGVGTALAGLALGGWRRRREA
jgi:LPXTG-motif cell wall-anchored protein